MVRSRLRQLARGACLLRLESLGPPRADVERGPGLRWGFAGVEIDLDQASVAVVLGFDPPGPALAEYVLDHHRLPGAVDHFDVVRANVDVSLRARQAIGLA